MALRPDIALEAPPGPNAGFYPLDAKFRLDRLDGLLTDADEGNEASAPIVWLADHLPRIIAGVGAVPLTPEGGIHPRLATLLTVLLDWVAPVSPLDGYPHERGLPSSSREPYRPP